MPRATNGGHATKTSHILQTARPCRPRQSLGRLTVALPQQCLSRSVSNNHTTSGIHLCCKIWVRTLLQVCELEANSLGVLFLVRFNSLILTFGQCKSLLSYLFPLRFMLCTCRSRTPSSPLFDVCSCCTTEMVIRKLLPADWAVVCNCPTSNSPPYHHHMSTTYRDVLNHQLHVYLSYAKFRSSALERMLARQPPLEDFG